MGNNSGDTDHRGIASPLARNPDDDDPGPDRETPVAPLLAGGLMDIEGQATDGVESSLWSGVEIDILRPHMLRVASECLTGKQLEVFTAAVNGKSVTTIADDLGLSHQAVSQHLRGQRGAGGAMRRIRDALIQDEDFLLDVAVARTGRTIPDPGAIIREWFKGLRQSTIHQFVPRCVLLVMLYAADSKRTLSFRDAYEHLPSAAVNHAMPVLKALGYVETDGVTIRIRKLPIEENQ